MPILSILIVLPLAGALIVALLPKRRPELVFPMALVVSIAPLAAALYVLWNFTAGDASFQFSEHIVLVESFGISWSLAVDGISLFMVVLTALLFPLSIAASRSISEQVKMYMVLMLVLETGVLGVFLSLDLFVFFAFFEIVLIPMYLLISMWGSDNRAYAALKFVLFTAVGSAFLLVSIVALAVLTGTQMGTFANFDFRNVLQTDLSTTTQYALFAGFAIAFAIKVPLFPFHTWLPDAHTEAPTAGSVILAGVLLKMGTYGFLRFNLTLFPEATVDFAVPLAILAVIGIVYGAAVAIVQPDIKRLVAYSSVSHLGFVMLGMFAFNPMGLKGSIMQMVNHGISTGALFLLVGIIYERRHTRMISEYGGIAKRMPVYATMFLIAALSSMGLPALNGFVGEFTILLGVANRSMVWAAFAALGIVLGAAYLLWMYQRVFWGPLDNPANEDLKDLNLREVLTLVPLVICMFWIGLYPKPVFEFMEKPVEYIVHKVDPDYFDRAGVEYPEPPLYEREGSEGHARLNVPEN